MGFSVCAVGPTGIYYDPPDINSRSFCPPHCMVSGAFLPPCVPIFIAISQLLFVCGYTPTG